MLRFCPLFSGSSGNSVYIGDRSGGLLVDVGRSAKQTNNMLKEIGVEPEFIKGILITHEHSDHVGGLSVFAAKHNIPVYASAGTLLALKEKNILNAKHIDIALNDEKAIIGDMLIEPFRTSHDCADSRGFVITGSDGTTRVSVATDTGYLSPEMLQKLTGAKLSYIESNHDVKMLKNGSYPYTLQERILSEKGHLSNEACAAALKALVNKGTTHFVLAHLSRENNTPSLAYNAATSALTEAGALENRDYILDIAAPENESGIMII